MPWRETDRVKERQRFIEDWESGQWTMAGLCRRYGIARPTGYKWARRFKEDGEDGLQEQSRRPMYCPHETSAAMVDLILKTKRKEGWGARKLRRVLLNRHPELEVPARSTIFDILERHGLVRKRRRRRNWKHPGAVPLRTTKPNQVWTADFKGQFKTRDGAYCYPLTVADHHTRSVLCCTALGSVKTKGAKPAFERVFREFGLPAAIRTDNGVPFASVGVHGLCELNVWWMKLGIVQQRIEPSSPQQNGAHERMHKTLKAETTNPPAKNLQGQQRKFDAWRRRFNEERPHEALDDDTPASRYKPSSTPFPETIVPPEYPPHFEVRRVSNSGDIRIHSHQQFLSKALMGEHVGLEEVDDGLWDIVYYDTLLARFDAVDRSLSGVKRVKDVPGHL